MPPGGGEQPPGYGQPPPAYGQPPAPAAAPPPPPPPPPGYEAPPPPPAGYESPPDPHAPAAPQRPDLFEPPPAYVPAGPGAAAHYGAPLGSHDPGAYINPNRQGPVYAGFWRRAWARWITALASSIVLGTGYSLILFGTFWIHQNTAVCTITTSGQQVCQRQGLFLLVGLALTWIYGITVSYYMWSRRLATHGATIGMAQMGLSIKGSTTFGTISKGRAFRRSVIALLPAVFASGISWIFLFDPSENVLVIAYVGLGVLSVLVALGGLWMLVDAQRRTLWDIVGETIVVVDRDPSWFAVVALVFASLVPSAASLTFTLIGLEKLRDEFDDFSAGDASIQRILVYVLPVALACIGAIVFGHLGVRATKWDARRLSGRGIAVAGTLVGYSVPALAVMSLLFSFLYTRLTEREARTCKETRKELEIAAASFKTLNGEDPPSIDALGLPIYMNDEELDADWKIASKVGGGIRFVGLGDCKKS